jgi:predicted DCC family thiol-disulfide oxidoreductase YuxK
VVAVPNQARGALDRYGLSRAQADENAWVVTRGGRVSGAEAVNAALRAIGGGWAALGRVLSLPPLAALERLGYRWFATRRSRFAWLGVTPECDEPGADCEPGVP